MRYFLSKIAVLATIVLHILYCVAFQCYSSSSPFMFHIFTQTLPLRPMTGADIHHTIDEYEMLLASQQPS